MIAEGAFGPERFGRIDVALDHEVGMRGDLQVDGLAFHQRHRFLAQEPRQQYFVEAVRLLCDGAIPAEELITRVDPLDRVVDAFFERELSAQLAPLGC